METRGDMRQGSGSRQHSFGRRLRVSAAGAIVIGGAIFLGGAATLVTAFANTGHAFASEDCTGWKASATLDNNVTDRLVTVTFPDSSTTVKSAVYTTDGSNGQPKSTPTIWSDSGTNNQMAGTVTLTIYNAADKLHGVDGTPQTATLKPATNCQASPDVDTTASSGGAVGTALTDAATLTGGNHPTGTVVFKLFPSVALCNAGTGAVYTSPAEPLSASAPFTATSGSFSPTAVGTYQWQATYSGDTNNDDDSSECGSEPVTISKTAPTIATAASAGGTAPVSVSDTATLSGAVGATGTVTFTLYSDATCMTSVFTSTNPLSSSAPFKATSGSFSASAGAYQWVAKYNGDANNAASLPSKCGDEPVTITAGGGGVLGITTTVTIPSTGSAGSLTGITLGGFLILGGLVMALAGAIVPRRRHSR